MRDFVGWPDVLPPKITRALDAMINSSYLGNRMAAAEVVRDWLKEQLVGLNARVTTLEEKVARFRRVMDGVDAALEADTLTEAKSALLRDSAATEERRPGGSEGDELIERRQGPAKAIFFGGNVNADQNPVCSLVLEDDLRALEAEVRRLRRSTPDGEGDDDLPHRLETLAEQLVKLHGRDAAESDADDLRRAAGIVRAAEAAHRGEGGTR